MRWKKEVNPAEGFCDQNEICQEIQPPINEIQPPINEMDSIDALNTKFNPVNASAKKCVTFFLCVILAFISFFIVFFCILYVLAFYIWIQDSTILKQNDLSKNELQDQQKTSEFRNVGDFWTPLQPISHTGIYLEYLNVSNNPMDDFYEFSCGNFREFADIEDEMWSQLKQESRMFLNYIEQYIIVEGVPFLTTNTNPHKYYSKCMSEKLKKIDRTTSLIRRLEYEMDNKCLFERKEDKTENSRLLTNAKFCKIRFLIKNGITNFVHLTKEESNVQYKNGVPTYQYIHYLRPGGVLFPEDRHDKNVMHLLNMFGTLESSEKRQMTIRDFLNDFPNWVEIFGQNAKLDDVLYIENMGYFVNLDAFLSESSLEQVTKKLDWFLEGYWKFFDGRSCLDQTKMLYPVTMCRTFMLLGGFYDDYNIRDKELAKDLVQNVFEQFKDISKSDLSFRVGGCSSILNSETMDSILFDVENSFHYEMFDLHSIHRTLFKKWSEVYDPLYIYFTYPKMLHEFESHIDWVAAPPYSFYDKFHHSVVILPGMIKNPVFDHGFTQIAKYAKLGAFVGHEISHHHQLQILNKRRDLVTEFTADIEGVLKAYECIKHLDNACDFFLAYAQSYCSWYPDKSKDEIHPSPRVRVNIVAKNNPHFAKCALSLYKDLTSLNSTVIERFF